MGNVNDLNDIEQKIINLIHAEIESMKKMTPDIETTSGWKPLCDGENTRTFSGVEVGIGNYSKKRAIASKEFLIEISNEGTLIVHDKKNRYQVINDADKRAAAIQAIFNAVPQKYWGKSTNQVIPHVPQPTPVIPATDAVSSINMQAPVTSQASVVRLSFENEIAALTDYKTKIQSDNNLDNEKMTVIVNAIDVLEAALRADCETYPQLLDRVQGYIKGMNYGESNIIKLYAEYAVACMERVHPEVIRKLGSRIVNHRDYHLVSERSRFAFAQVAVAGFIIGLVAVGVMVPLSALIPEVATFMDAVAKIFAEGMKGYNVGFDGNATLNGANLMVSTVVASTAVGAVVGYSRQKPLSANDIHSLSLNQAIVASKPLSLDL